jgi:ribosomal protein S14
MNQFLKQWIIDGLRETGAEIDFGADKESAEVMIDSEITAKLPFPEFFTVRFGNNLNEGEIPAHGALVDSLEKLYCGGDTPITSLSLDLPPPKVPLKKAETFLSVENGKTVFCGLEETMETYLILWCRYSAVSDEKKESAVNVAMNIQTGTISEGLGTSVERILGAGRLFNQPGTMDKPDYRIYRLLTGAVKAVVQEDIKDFSDSQRRRMERDSERIYQYYSSILAEDSRKRNKRKKDGSDLTAVSDAVIREYLRKTEDLKIKYLTRISWSPLAAINIQMRCIRPVFTVHMGVKSKNVSVPVNPLTMKPDLTMCELCGRPARTVRLCREFHWLCRECFKTCAVCGKVYCPVCRPGGCVHG